MSIRGYVRKLLSSAAAIAVLTVSCVTPVSAVAAGTADGAGKWDSRNVYEAEDGNAEVTAVEGWEEEYPDESELDAVEDMVPAEEGQTPEAAGEALEEASQEEAAAEEAGGEEIEVEAEEVCDAELPVPAEDGQWSGPDPALDEVSASGNSTWLDNYEYDLDKENGYVVLKNYISSNSAGDSEGTTVSSIEIRVPAQAEVDGTEYRVSLNGTVYRNERGSVTGGGIWYDSRNIITSISFNEGVKAPADASFMFCNIKAKYIDLSGLDTSDTTDMSYMFYGSVGVGSLDLSGFDTSKVTNMTQMFYKAVRAADINLSGLDFSNVGTFSSMFYGCSSLKNISFGTAANTSSVSSMYSMFYENEALESLDLSGLDTGSVENFRSMFRGCVSLNQLKLGENFRTSNAKAMNYMFYNCESLEKLDLSLFDTSATVSMDWMFYGCSSVSSMDLSSFDTSAADNMYCMFYGCTSLRSLDLSSFNTGSVENMRAMFMNCRNLESLNLGSSFNTANVWTMYRMFYNCRMLQSLDVSSFSNTEKVENMAEMFDFCQSLKTLDLSVFSTPSLISMNAMFANCELLESLDVSRFNTSGVDDMYALFYGCEAVTGLDLSSFDTSKVTNMRAMFRNCYRLKSINFGSGFNTSNVENMYCMFYACRRLEGIDLSGFDTRKAKVLSYMFFNCRTLTQLDVTAFDMAGAVSMDSMFNYCRNVGTLTLGNMNSGNVKNMNKLFANCWTLSSVDLSGLSTNSAVSMNEMFLSSNSISSLDLSGFDMSNVTEAQDMLSSIEPETIKTPVNVPLSIALSGTYYDDEANSYAELPQNTATSLTLYNKEMHKADFSVYTGIESISVNGKTLSADETLILVTGDTISVSAGVRSGFIFSEWECTGVDGSTESSFSFTMPSRDIKVGAYARCVVVSKQKLDLHSVMDGIATANYFVVSDKKLASVSKKGLLKAKKKAGTIRITAYRKTGSMMTELEQMDVTIENPVFTVKKLQLPITSVGSTFDLSSAEYLNGLSYAKPDSWESKKSEVASIDSSTGILTIKGAGSTQITAYFGSGKNAAKLKLKVKVK